MNVLLTSENRFDRAPDGSVWSAGPFAYAFFARYREVFDEVRVVARVRQVGEPSVHSRRADGPGVWFHDFPHYRGPWQFARRYPAIRASVRAALLEDHAILLRVPSAIGSVVANRILGSGRPFGVIVVGDPMDVFSAGSVKSPLRFWFRWRFARNLRHQCLEASACRFVTEYTLQRRYPPGPAAYATHGSDVDLQPEAFATGPRIGGVPLTQPNIVTVGTLDQLYKAPDVLIDAVAACRDPGFRARLTFIGDGQYRGELESRASRRGIGDRVRFLGQMLPGEPIRKALDLADLFVLPSRQEGLPRAMIEAMARGLPCLGSTVGGIPELLLPEDMVPPGRVLELARKIREVSGDPARLAAMSARNLDKAREFGVEVLRARRRVFHEYLRDRTVEWRDARGVGRG